MKLIRLTIILLVCAFGLVGPSLIHANGPAHATGTSPTAAQQVTAANKRLWNLQNADIRAVIAAISRETGKNFIIDPRVRGNVTIVSSTPISAQEAYQVFLSALQVMGYAAVPNGNAIKIVPSVNAKGMNTPIANAQYPGIGDEMVVRVIPVRNVSATQLVSILRPLMPEWSNVSAYAPANSLILAGRAGNIERLAKIVKRVDQVNTNEIELIPLHNASASKVVNVLNTLLAADRGMGKSANISLAADSQGNSILMSGSRTDRLRLRVLISQLDSPTATGDTNTEVIPLNYLQAKTLAPVLAKIAHASYLISANGNGTKGSNGGLGPSGLNGGNLTNGTGQTPTPSGSKPTTTDATTQPITGTGTSKTVSIEAEISANAIIISAPPLMMRTLKRVIKRLDVRPSQVLVEAIIAEVSDNLAQQLGIEWGTVSSATTSTAATPDASTGAEFQPGFGIIKSGDIGVLINALSTSGSSDILSTPSVVVLNNQKALISVGQNIGLFNRSYAATSAPATNGDDGSVFPFNTIQRTNVALSLEVIPQISPDNSVRLEIDQKNDSLPSADADNPSGNQVINTSNLKTTVIVNSGDILVLGGLKNHNKTASDGKVPILGDIPLLGKIFHFKKKSAEKRNLMIFIKPVVLDSRQANNRVSRRAYGNIRRVQLDRAEGRYELIHAGVPVLEPLYKPKAQLPSPFSYHQ